MYAPGVKIAVQAYPNPSSLILGGILCIVEISARYVEYQERLSDMLSTMGKKAEILTRFGDEIYATEDTIQLALAEVYGDILDFCREASGLLFKNEKEKTGFRILKRSLWEPFESKLGAIMQKFDQDLDIYKLQAELCTQRREEYSRVMQHHSTLLQFQMQQGLASLQSSSQSMLDHDERRQTEEDRKRREDGRILRGKATPTVLL
jgi:hypothetical protein